MTIAQCKAVRRRFATGDLSERYYPKKGKRGQFANASQRRAASKNRKRMQMGGRSGSIGFGSN